MIIDCARYVDGQRESNTPMSLDDAATPIGGNGFVWLGLFEPTPDELEQVRATFGLHSLAIEDVQTFHLRPKAEIYESGVQLVILRTVRYDDAAEEVDFGEIGIFVGPSFVITVRQGIASDLRPARSALEATPELARLGTSSVLWAILDQVVESYNPVVAELERDIEQVEGTVFSGSVAPTERIYFLRREVTNFYRAVHPLLAVFAAIERGARDLELLPYLHDVHDHLLLVNEEVAAQRDLLATILEANMAVITVEQTRVSVRQSSTMEQLTVLSTIFLPLTFVTGFFGQNFGWLVDHVDGVDRFIVFGVGGLLIPLIALWLWFRRTRRTEGPTIAAQPYQRVRQ